MVAAGCTERYESFTLHGITSQDTVVKTSQANVFFLSGALRSSEISAVKKGGKWTTKLENYKGWRTENWSLKKCKRTTLCFERVAYGLSEF